MSADPEVPTDSTRVSGGHVVKNMIYRHEGSDLEIMTGWKDQGTREYNQEIVPPAKLDMDKQHPCFKLNKDVVECSLRCPNEMRLAGRVASCNDERRLLMQCLTRHKQWTPPVVSKPWYVFW